MAIVEKLDLYQLTHILQRMLTRLDVVDHQFLWSIYFLGPDDNRIKVTTYDYASVVSTGRETS